MRTTLNTRAYLIPLMYIFVLILGLILVAGRENINLEEISFEDSGKHLLVFAFWLVYFIFSLFSFYKEYSFNKKTLVIKDLISGKQTSIDLCDIKELELIKNRYHYDILIQTRNRQYTLKGAYIRKMEMFFHELNKAVKKV